MMLSADVDSPNLPPRTADNEEPTNKRQETDGAVSPSRTDSAFYDVKVSHTEGKAKPT